MPVQVQVIDSEPSQVAVNVRRPFWQEFLQY